MILLKQRKSTQYLLIYKLPFIFLLQLSARITIEWLVIVVFNKCVAGAEDVTFV